MRKRLLISSLLLLSVSHFTAFADDGTARRYLSDFEDPDDTEFFLLINYNVRKYLIIPDDRYEEIKKLIIKHAEQRFALNKEVQKWLKTDEAKKLARDAKDKQLDTKRESIRTSLYSGVMKDLGAALDKKQFSLLANLTFQYRGPLRAINNIHMRRQLKISDDDFAAITKKLNVPDRHKDPDMNEYFGMQFTLPKPGQDMVDRWNITRHLYWKISNNEREVDQNTLGLLSSDQKANWKTLCGEPFPIEWGPKPIRLFYASDMLKTK